jgi:hypothetical protein
MTGGKSPGSVAGQATGVPAVVYASAGAPAGSGEELAAQGPTLGGPGGARKASAPLATDRPISSWT